MKIKNAILLGIIIMLGLSCAKSEKEKALLDAISNDEPVQEAFNVRFIFSEKATVQALLEAPHVQTVIKNQQEVSIFNKGVHLKFFTPEGKQRSDLTANYGEFKKEFGQAVVRGNVVVINEKGERMETEMLEWDNERDSIYTKEFVKIYTADEIIYGDGIRAKSDFSAYKFYNIRGSIRLKDGEPASPVPEPGDSTAPAANPGGHP